MILVFFVTKKVDGYTVQYNVACYMVPKVLFPIYNSVSDIYPLLVKWHYIDIPESKLYIDWQVRSFDENINKYK